MSTETWESHTTELKNFTKGSQSANITFSPRKDYDAQSVFFDASKEFQEILGFGGALTESSAVNLFSVPQDTGASLIQDYYDPEIGSGYSFCRIHMNSCDFSLDNFSCLETDNDHDLKSFQMDRFEKYILPWLKLVKQSCGETLKILVSPWSPPAWMKTTGKMNNGGKLRKDCRETWAKCYVRFAKAMAAEGFPVWGFTVQNEPSACPSWDSCLYTAEEERDFIRDYLGPEFKKSGLENCKILVWDHNRDLLIHRAAIIYSDPAASQYVWGTAFHWYGEPCYENVKKHREAWPDKHLLFTEGCQEFGTHFNSFIPAERYATSIIKDLNNGTCGWIDWNLFLDDAGGPNHVSNLCSSPVLIRRDGQAIHRQPSFHYLRHFSRYIKPGAKRILCAAGTESVDAVGVINPDGKVCLTLLNTRSHNCSIKLYTPEKESLLELPAHSLTTILK